MQPAWSYAAKAGQPLQLSAFPELAVVLRPPGALPAAVAALTVGERLPAPHAHVLVMVDFVHDRLDLWPDLHSPGIVADDDDDATAPLVEAVEHFLRQRGFFGEGTLGTRAVNDELDVVDALRTMDVPRLAARAQYLTGLAPDDVVRVTYAMLGSGAGPVLPWSVDTPLPRLLRPLVAGEAAPTVTAWLNVSHLLAYAGYNPKEAQEAMAAVPELAPRRRILLPGKEEDEARLRSLRMLADPGRAPINDIEDDCYRLHLLGLVRAWMLDEPGIIAPTDEFVHLTARLFLALLGEPCLVPKHSSLAPRHRHDDGRPDLLVGWIAWGRDDILAAWGVARQAIERHTL